MLLAGCHLCLRLQVGRTLRQLRRGSVAAVTAEGNANALREVQKFLQYKKKKTYDNNNKTYKRCCRRAKVQSCVEKPLDRRRVASELSNSISFKWYFGIYVAIDMCMYLYTEQDLLGLPQSLQHQEETSAILSYIYIYK